MMWHLRDLMEWTHQARVQINGRWVPCRPVRNSTSWRLRLRSAWSVLTGRADAFFWPEGQ